MLWVSEDNTVTTTYSLAKTCPAILFTKASYKAMLAASTTEAIQ